MDHQGMDDTMAIVTSEIVNATAAEKTKAAALVIAVKVVLE